MIKTIGELQDRFSKCFPHLKPEFYKFLSKQKTPDALLNKYAKVSDVRERHDAGTIRIMSWHTVRGIKI